MRVIVFCISCLFSITCWANNIIVNGTRFIYPSDEKEITVQLTNSANRPAIAQAWLDEGDATQTPDTIKTPFQISPPVSRLEAKGGQALRIKLMDKRVLSNDQETLFWLNILDIPPTAKKKTDENFLQLAIRSRFKFIYRPVGLGNRDKAPEQLLLTAKSNQLIVNNPSPFFITITKVSPDGKASLIDSAIMLAPKATQTIELTKPIKSGSTVIINNINDYGADIAVKKIVK